MGRLLRIPQRADDDLPIAGLEDVLGPGLARNEGAVPQHPVPVIPAERAGLRPASVSRNPVIKAVRAFTPALDYWVPARASPLEPGSLGRDDSPHMR